MFLRVLCFVNHFISIDQSWEYTEPASIIPKIEEEHCLACAGTGSVLGVEVKAMGRAKPAERRPNRNPRSASLAFFFPALTSRSIPHFSPHSPLRSCSQAMHCQARYPVFIDSIKFCVLMTQWAGASREICRQRNWYRGWEHLELISEFMPKSC